MKYFSAKTVTKILGVTAQTLRNWDKEGKLKPTYVKSNGYRYYSEESILSYTQERKTKKNLSVIGYARVSSKKQSDDLERQAENIKKFCQIGQKEGFAYTNCSQKVCSLVKDSQNADLDFRPWNAILKP